MKHTSFLANKYMNESGRKETLREKVYAYINQYPHSTQLDVSRDLSESSRKRISELVKDGSVFESGIKEIDGFKYTTYCTSNVVQQDLF